MHPSCSLAQFLAHVRPFTPPAALSRNAFRVRVHNIRSSATGMQMRGYAHKKTTTPPAAPHMQVKAKTNIPPPKIKATRDNIMDANRDRSAVGVFGPRAALVFCVAGAGLYAYFRWEKQRLEEQKQKERESRTVGRAMVGGPFQMQTHDGKPFTEKDLLGKWSLIYFGFTNCPDICPDELDKMTAAVNEIDKAYGPIVQPIFVSVDPARDSPEQLSLYLHDFHPRLLALTGDYAATKAMCKAYRVYFSTPPDAKVDDDYLVDHSIFFYLMDPDGMFVEAFGKSSEAGEVVERFAREVEQWRKERGNVV